MVENLEMMMLYTYHMGNLTSEELVQESIVPQKCGIRFHCIFRDLNTLQYVNMITMLLD